MRTLAFTLYRMDRFSIEFFGVCFAEVLVMLTVAVCVGVMLASFPS